MRNHGQIDPKRLPPQIQTLMLELARELATQDGLVGVQFTWHADRRDEPPTVHVICAPEEHIINYWFGKEQE